MQIGQEGSNELFELPAFDLLRPVEEAANRFDEKYFGLDRFVDGGHVPARHAVEVRVEVAVLQLANVDKAKQRDEESKTRNAQDGEVRSRVLENAATRQQKSVFRHGRLRIEHRLDAPSRMGLQRARQGSLRRQKTTESSRGGQMPEYRQSFGRPPTDGVAYSVVPSRPTTEKWERRGRPPRPSRPAAAPTEAVAWEAILLKKVFSPQCSP